MRRRLALILVTLVGDVAHADDAKPAAPAAPGAPVPAAKSAPSPTPEQAADAVLAALRTKDDTALRALAAKDDPQPWDVGHELVLRGELGAAERFAKAAIRPRTEGLAAYVSSRRRAPVDPAMKAAADAFRAASRQTRQPASVLQALDPLGDPGSMSDPLMAQRVLWLRGGAFEALGRRGEARDTYDAMVRVAESNGDRGAVVAGIFRAGECCAPGEGDLEASLEYRRRLVVANEAMREPQWLAFSLARYGLALVRAGNRREALSVLERANAMIPTLPDDKVLPFVLAQLAPAYLELDRPSLAAPLFERRAALHERSGEIEGAIGALLYLSIAHVRRGAPRAAVAPLERALRLASERKDEAAVAALTGELGIVKGLLGDVEGSLDCHQRSLRHAESTGDWRGQAVNLAGIADVAETRGEFSAAIETLRRVIELAEAHDDAHLLRSALSRLGLLHCSMGDLPKALATERRVLGLLGDHPSDLDRATTLQHLGLVYMTMGDLPAALESLHEAERSLGDVGGESALAIVWMTLGSIYGLLGDDPTEIEYESKALAVFERIGDARAAGMVLGNTGQALESSGDAEGAAGACQRSLEIAEREGDRLSALHARFNLGRLRTKVNPKGAAADYPGLLREAEALGAKGEAAMLRLAIGRSQAMAGDLVGAVAAFERVAREAEKNRVQWTLLAALESLAEAHLEANRPEVALATARRAMPVIEAVTQGASDAQTATIRSDASGLYAVGARAAVRLNNVEEAGYFVESGRAGALLESMSNREALRDATLPPDVRRAESSARAAQNAAASAYAKALESEDLQVIRSRRRDLDAADTRVREVADEIQGAQKRAAGILYPRAATLDDIRAALAPGDALVLFATRCSDPFALVVTRDGAPRVAKLGSRATIEGACGALALSDPTVDAGAALREAAKSLTDPLVLGDDIRRVLVSPDGDCSYVPFAALMPARLVVCVQSGTTLLQLQEDLARHGESTLAIGNPDYSVPSPGSAASVYAEVAARGSSRGRLSPLPASADEARAVGDSTLLGAEATEEGVLSRIATRRRWRGIHFACHGLVDPDHPARSSLALTPSAKNDGFLSVVEVFGSKIPADLVVLSACETGRGKIVNGEGIVGLTRAFMFAGTPRVICSLWRVDDEATKALMVKFYELWNPKDGKRGLPTAEALKQAQEFVKSHPKWKHPYFWAAWVLWGLPD